MDRLETVIEPTHRIITGKFTFQYGQIRNNFLIYTKVKANFIYIPVWIDQKHLESDQQQ